MDDGSVALVLMAVLLFAVIFGPLYGADSRRAWKDVNRRPRVRVVGSMRRSDWDDSDL